MQHQATPCGLKVALHTSHFTLHSSRSGILPNTSPMQHSCSLYNAICNRTLQNTIEDIEEPITGQNDPSRNRVTQELPFIAGCSHFTRKSTMFLAPASSPTQVLVLLCIVLCKYCYVCIVIAIPVAQMYLSATRKIASQLPLITLKILQITIYCSLIHNYYRICIHYNTAILRTSLITTLPSFLSTLHTLLHYHTLPAYIHILHNITYRYI